MFFISSPESEAITTDMHFPHLESTVALKTVW